MHSFTKLAIIGAAVAVYATDYSGEPSSSIPSSTIVPSSSIYPSGSASASSSASASGLSTTSDIPDTTIPYPTPPPSSACPTVTETASVCSTCYVPQCLVISTLTQGCDCPNEPVTQAIAFTCGGYGEDTCKGIGCPTSYTIVTATDCGGYPVPSGSSSSGYPVHSDSSKPAPPPVVTRTGIVTVTNSEPPVAGPSDEPSGSTPPAPSSSEPVQAGAAKFTGAVSLAGAVLAAGVFAML